MYVKDIKYKNLIIERDTSPQNISHFYVNANLHDVLVPNTNIF